MYNSSRSLHLKYYTMLKGNSTTTDSMLSENEQLKATEDKSYDYQTSVKKVHQIANKYAYK